MDTCPKIFHLPLNHKVFSKTWWMVVIESWGVFNTEKEGSSLTTLFSSAIQCYWKEECGNKFDNYFAKKVRGFKNATWKMVDSWLLLCCFWQENQYWFRIPKYNLSEPFWQMITEVKSWKPANESKAHFLKMALAKFHSSGWMGNRKIHVILRLVCTTHSVLKMAVGRS